MKKKINWKEVLFWFVLIIMPYIGIPLLWGVKREYKRNTKIIISIVAAVWCIYALGSSDGEQSSGTVGTDVVSESSEIVEVASENFETEKYEDTVLSVEETTVETEKSSG